MEGATVWPQAIPITIDGAYLFIESIFPDAISRYGEPSQGESLVSTTPGVETDPGS
jgi:hypothetical protein